MKLSKSTSILINAALILVLAILIKSLIAFPQNANAQAKKEYFVKSTDTLKGAQKVLNERALDGWRLSFIEYGSEHRDLIFIMER